MAQQDPKKPEGAKNEDELPESELDQASGGARAGIGIGSFGTISGGTPKAKIKVGGVGNWDEDEK